MTELKGRFPFNPKFRKFRLVHHVEWSMSVWFNWNIRDNLWRYLTKLLSPVPLFCILLTKSDKPNAGWLGPGLCNRITVPLDTRNFRNFKPQFLLNEKCTRSKFWCRLSENPWLASLIYSIYYLHKHHTFVKISEGPDAIKQGNFLATK